MSKVSILLAHYSPTAEPFLEACLKSISAQTYRSQNQVETILISSNNMPTCNFYGIVDDHYHSGERLHFPAAIQEAYKRSSGDILLLLNDDAIMSKNCLSALVATVSDHAIVGARSNCGPIMGFYHSHSGYMIDGRTEIVPPQFRSPENAHYMINHAIEYPPGLFKVPFSPFFCTAMKRSVYDRVGGIETRFRTGSDDLEFAQRAFHYGIFCYVALHATVFHASGMTADDHLTEDDRNFNHRLMHDLASK